MNLTTLQQRRLELTEDELTRLETSAKKHGTFFWVKLTLLFIVLAFTIEILWSVLIDKETLVNSFNNYNWRSLAVGFVAMLIMNVWLYRVSGSQIKSKRKELTMLRKKYGVVNAVNAAS